MEEKRVGPLWGSSGEGGWKEPQRLTDREALRCREMMDGWMDGWMDG